MAGGRSSATSRSAIFIQPTLMWNGKQLPVVLDHKDGNKYDNSPGNLRFLCPNCDAQQLETRGGANRGRVSDLTEDGYTVNVDKKSGRKIVAATGRARGSGECRGAGRPPTRS